MIPIHKPYLPKSCLEYAYEALKSGWVSTGKFNKLASEKLKDLLNIKHVLLTCNGTAANHLMIKCLFNDDDKNYNVIIPNNVYIAAINPFLYENKKFNLIPIDCNIDTWNINIDNVKKHISIYNTDNILIVHNLGNIIDIVGLKREFPKLRIFEDNCEGFLGKYNDIYSGTESICSTISFFANKIITCGEGGALLTNDSSIFERANLIHGQGQSKEKFIHSELGYNYRLTNIQAALLYGQLEILSEIKERKKEIFLKYRKDLSNIDNILFQKIDENTEHSYWNFAVRFKNNNSYIASEKFFSDKGIETRPMFYPIYYHNHFKEYSIYNFTNAEILSKECVLFPSYIELTNSEQDYIINSIKEYLKVTEKR